MFLGLVTQRTFAGLHRLRLTNVAKAIADIGATDGEQAEGGGRPDLEMTHLPSDYSRFRDLLW